VSDQTAPLIAIRQIRVNVKELPRAVTFYRDTLGLPFLFEQHCADHDAHPVGRETPVAITKKSPSIAPIQALRVPNETIAEYERYYDVETLDVPGGGIPEPTNDLDGHCRFSTQQGGTRIQERGASRAPHHWKRRKMARLSCGDGRDSAREAHGKEGVNGSSPLGGSAVSVWLSQI
jgi:catechol 2,3-dioxygenase-like lactoylglutathione lyase family enzyme